MRLQLTAIASASSRITRSAYPSADAYVPREPWGVGHAAVTRVWYCGISEGVKLITVLLRDAAGA